MDFSKTLAALEELIYEVFVWVLLLPKTLTKVLVNPKWIITYIDEQLSIEDNKKRFNEYLSPILFWLLLVGISSLLNYKLVEPVIVNALENNPTFSKIKETVPLLYSSLNLISILTFTAVYQMLQKSVISRETLRRTIYFQFYCFTPLQFISNIFGIYWGTLNPSQIEYIFYNPFLYIWLATFIWFWIAEVIVISNGMNRSKLFAFGTVALSYFLSAIIFLVLFFIIVLILM